MAGAGRVLRPRIAGVAIPAPLVDAGRSAFRGYGMATSRWRPLPDFLLIGAKRCGTTSLYYHLLQHPAALPLFPEARLLPKARDGKGPHYFDTHYARGPTWYRSHFPSTLRRRRVARAVGGPVVSGEASPYSLYHPLAPARAHDLVPTAKLLVLLRDPVERTYSHYREQRRNGTEALSFEDALEAEQSRTAGEEHRLVADPTYRSRAHEQQSYRAQSEYVHGLRRWLAHYPPAQLHLVWSEDYYRDPVGVCRDILGFLGLPRIDLPAGEPLNAAPQAPVAPATVTRLREHFAPFDAELAALVGRRPPWR